MAQVARLVALMAALLAGAVLADPPVPDEGLRAEGEHRWDDALAAYHKALQKDPDRVDLLLRMADIENARKEPGEAARFTAQAAERRPNDAALQQRASQAWAIADKPKPALEAINRALKLDPENPEYLRAQADLALWNNDLDLAQHSLARVVDRYPSDGAAIHKLAQAQARAGRLDAAVENYERYERVNPKDADALLEHARVNMYRGDYSASRASLDRYRKVAGNTEEYRRADAEFCARAGCPTVALRKLEPLLASHPGDYDLHLVQTLALNERRDPGAALTSLASLDQLGPARPETAGTRLQIATPLRHSAVAFGEYYGDTSGLGIERDGLRGVLVPATSSRVSLEMDHWRLQADSRSGLDGTDGVLGQGSVGQDVRGVQALWHEQVVPSFALELGGGLVGTDSLGDHKQYLGAAQWWPTDGLWFRLSRSRELLLISPRTVQLGIDRTGEELGAQWQPTLWSTVDLVANLDNYSDGNGRRQVILGPRVAVVRSESHVLDVGLRAQWIHFSRDTFIDDPATPGSDVTHGYYAPADFRRLYLTDFYYWKHDDQSGVGVMLGVGPERDFALDTRYRLGAEARVEGVMGVFRDWQLRGNAGYGGRAYGEAAQAGPYRGYSVGLELTRRF